MAHKRRKYPHQPVKTLLRSRWVWLTLLVAVCAVLGVLRSSWTVERHRALRALDHDLSLVTQESAAALDRALAQGRNDVHFLAQVPPIQGIIRAVAHGGVDPQEASSLAIWKDRLERIFVAFARSNSDVLQVRYIGVADGGLELVRVERRGGRITVAPAQQLQAKGQRDYVREARRLSPGEAWVSSINLNREHGQVEIPHQPTLRFATPVFDSADVFGLVVINLNAGPLLSALTRLAQPGRVIHVLNGAGDFLAHPDPARAFGFELGHPSGWQEEFTPVPGEAPGQLQRYRRGPAMVYVHRHRTVLNADVYGSFIETVAVVPEEVVDAQAMHATMEDAARIAVVGSIALVIVMLYWVSTQERLRGREARARASAIVNSSSDAIISTDLGGVVVDWNRAAERLLGYTIEECVGKPLSTMLVQADIPALPLDVDGLVGPAAEAVGMELRCRRKSGSDVHVALTTSVVRDPSGKRIGAAVILRDVTEEKAKQATIVRLNENLERQIEERTRSLEKARTEAEASSLAKGQFLANMTHEIRTPMNAILGTLQLLRDTRLSDSQRRYTATAEAAAEALLRTLNAILDYSKIEAGKLALDNGPFHLRALFREAAAVLSATIGSKNIDVVFDITPELPEVVVGDGLRLQQVLINLAGNAIKFTDRGHVLISARTDRPVAC